MSCFSKKDADDSAYEIQFMISTKGGDCAGAVENAAGMGVNLENINTRNEFIRSCRNLSMNARMHIHRGHTPAEVFKNY